MVHTKLASSFRTCVKVINECAHSARTPQQKETLEKFLSSPNSPLRDFTSFQKRLIVLRLYDEGLLMGEDAVSMKEVDLSGAQLDNSSLRNATLAGANLRNASLRESDLGHINLQHADLRGANVQLASLWYADLRYAQLTGMNIEGAKLDFAYVQPEELKECIGSRITTA